MKDFASGSSPKRVWKAAHIHTSRSKGFRASIQVQPTRSHMIREEQRYISCSAPFILLTNQTECARKTRINVRPLRTMVFEVATSLRRERRPTPTLLRSAARERRATGPDAHIQQLMRRRRRQKTRWRRHRDPRWLAPLLFANEIVIMTPTGQAAGFTCSRAPRDKRPS